MKIIFTVFLLICTTGLFSEVEKADLEKYLSYKISQCYFEMTYYEDGEGILYNSGMISAYKDIQMYLEYSQDSNLAD